MFLGKRKGLVERRKSIVNNVPIKMVKTEI
jgi:hypothetical protein